MTSVNPDTNAETETLTYSVVLKKTWDGVRAELGEVSSDTRKHKRKSSESTTEPSSNGSTSQAPASKRTRRSNTRSQA